jgi:hypothetical protein
MAVFTFSALYFFSCFMVDMTIISLNIIIKSNIWDSPQRSFRALFFELIEFLCSLQTISYSFLKILTSGKLEYYSNVINKLSYFT